MLVYAVQLHPQQKQPSLKLKTLPKLLLGSLQLAFALLAVALSGAPIFSRPLALPPKITLVGKGPPGTNTLSSLLSTFIMKCCAYG
jgi:hypothetical protein